EVPRSRVVELSRLPEHDVSQTLLVLFNDTHGSGNQFIREVWPAVDGLQERPPAVFVAAVTIAKEAIKRFATQLPGVHVIPGMPTPNARDLFSAETYARLKAIGERVYPKHPVGYGGTALLSAYYFQCPNNTLPLIWADGENNAVDGRAYPWFPLRRYHPKVTEP